VNGPKSQPPWKFLCSASSFSLQSFELSRLNHSANLRKEIGQLLDQWMEESATALLARWLLEQRERSARLGETSATEKESAQTAAGASDNFFSDIAISRVPL
jgi:hypothetical protein